MWGLLLSALDIVGLSPIPYLAETVKTTEQGFKLFMSLLICYPIAIVYHQYIRKHVEYRQIYFVLMGMDMAFYNFGYTMYHNMVPIFGFITTMKLLGPGKYHTIVTFTFSMMYLIIEYHMTESEEYDINWTLPHCVLTLKMIALAFDLWDGKLIAERHLSANLNNSALQSSPKIIEIIGFIYFPPGFLVGPIFSFRRYLDYISDKFPLEEQKQFVRRAWNKLLLSIVYMVIFKTAGMVFSMQYITSDEFRKHSIIYRHFYCGLWAHFALYKYISCWLLSEAACIRFGFSYNGLETTHDGRTISKWDGCNNVKLLIFEKATKFQHYIDSFNCQTNRFAHLYVYKRLEVLQNKNLSKALTLFFLAVWHGTKSGYYMCFFNEFLIMNFEKDVEAILVKTDIYHKVWASKICKCVLYALLKTYTIVFMGWSLVPFDLKEFSKWWDVYYSLYFLGFVLFLPWSFLYKPYLISYMRSLNLIPASSP